MLCDGRDVPFYATDITVWSLAVGDSVDGNVLLVTDSDFESHRLLGFPMSPSAYGEYEQAQYAVLDQKGAPLDVVVDWDEVDHLRVTVEEEIAGEDTQPRLLRGALPEA